MLFNPEHKNHEGLKAVKWLIEKSSVILEKEIEFENDIWHHTGKSFSGKIPYTMCESLRKLIKLGYEHPSDNLILNVSWIDSNQGEHNISVTFGHLKSNANQVNFVYNIFKK
jgi:hypothetical protein